MAVNLLSVEEVQAALQEADRETTDFTLKEKAKYMATRLRETASKHGLELKLRK